MSNTDVSWLADQSVNDFFARFPLPLAVLDKKGAVKLLNKRFTAVFDGSCLKSDTLRQKLLSTDAVKQSVTLLQRNDCLAEVYARRIDIDDDVILVLDDSAESTHNDALSDLRQRIADLEQLISNDRLTGAWNRSHFDKILKVELNRSVRYRQPVSLIMLDIDHFRQLNDKFGQEAGNEVLRALVRKISKNIRSSDMLFRWDGAQFAILVPSTGLSAAATQAETLRNKIAQHEFPAVGHITISLGVAEHVSSEGEETWFQHANDALHQAKEGGRNRVVSDSHNSSEQPNATSDTRIEHLEWQDSYLCGEPVIDGQHRELFRLANRLIDLGSASNGDDYQFNIAVQSLLAQLERHFNDEEAILARHEYGDLEVQSRAHQRLMEHVLQLRNAAASGNLALTELIDFLANEVVARHILKTDREYYPLFKEPPPYQVG